MAFKDTISPGEANRKARALGAKFYSDYYPNGPTGGMFSRHYYTTNVPDRDLCIPEVGYYIFDMDSFTPIERRVEIDRAGVLYPLEG